MKSCGPQLRRGAAGCFDARPGSLTPGILRTRPMLIPPFGHRLRFLLFAVCGLALSGCGGDGLQRVRVEGTVTVDGKPLRKGTVIFHPDDSKGNTLTTDAQGPIDAEGHYQLYVGGKPGIPTG